VRANRVTEAFQSQFAEFFEGETFAYAEVGNCVRYQDLFRLRMGAEPRSQLNCRSKEIVTLLDRFSRCGADSNLECALGVFLRVFL
jgi:hypothetical protein